MGEVALAAGMFGPALDPSQVTIRRQRWFPLQPRTTVMAPCGHIHFHPRSNAYRDDFSAEAVPLQALFIHEMTHVWQAQVRGRWYLPFARHPFCRYRYALRPGKPFEAYGIEQQAEIVAHSYRARLGGEVPSGANPADLEAILPF
jgi:hypothetical protein